MKDVQFYYCCDFNSIFICCFSVIIRLQLFSYKNIFDTFVLNYLIVIRLLKKKRRFFGKSLTFGVVVHIHVKPIKTKRPNYDIINIKSELVDSFAFLLFRHL